MNLSRFLHRALAVALPVGSTAAVFAHPGHDGDHGGGLTWDFVGETVHRLVHPYHAVPAFAVAALTLGILFYARFRAKNKRRE